MVKQGHYAKSSRKKVVRRFKQHHAVHEDRAIDDAKLKDFLLVRYHLTQAKSQRVVVQKTMQQFFGNWLQLATTDNAKTWDVTALTKQTLQLSNCQLPWQYYAVVNQQFATWQAFLTKEAPAVPLAERVTLTTLLTPASWQNMLSQQLAVNGLLGTLGGDVTLLQQIKTAQITQLQASLSQEQRLDWTKVAALCDPIKLETADFDQGMQGLLRRLLKLTPLDFNEVD
ncbi:hypothetical protein [Lactiplantibacillus daowaiensis]|uniref:Integrase n=1 Tax=Lactiplantibacillus daowaiensis TaxID=2559918 RepID=A0ABW1RZ44_9LACO|nr:hypothetical protein [Lactiplantibacillus daowaiensis]